MKEVSEMNGIRCKEPPGLPYSFDELGVRILKSNDSGHIYDDVLSIRSQIYGLPLSKVRAKGDEYSEHYCAYVNGQPLIILRATQARKGKIDCEEFYPPQLMTELRDIIISTTRFCSINRGTMPGLSLLLVQTLCLDQINQGMRIDIINVRLEMIDYYKNLGYVPIPDSSFIHPYWKTNSIAMILPTNPHRETKFKADFETLPDSLTYEDLLPYLKMK